MTHFIRVFLASGCLLFLTGATFLGSSGGVAGTGDISGVAATSPLTGGGTSGAVSLGCQSASGSQAGCLSSTDWTTFNNKGAPFSGLTTGTMPKAASSSTLADARPGYDYSVPWQTSGLGAFSNGGSPKTGNVSVGDATATIVNDGTYSAFPGLTRLLNGDLVVVYSSGSAHASEDSILKYRTSSDLGRTWSSATTIFTPGASTGAFDAEVMTLRDGTLLLSYVQSTSGANTAWVRRGTVSRLTGVITWGSAIAVTNSFTNLTTTNVSAKAIELTSGKLLLPIYGKNTGDTKYRAAIVSSTDGGLTWGSQVSLASASPTKDFTEANGVQLPSGKIVVIIRHETDLTGYDMVSSTDDGVTWTATTNVIDLSAALPGRPTVMALGSGGIFLLTRTGGGNTTGYATSWDEGATWTAFTAYQSVSNQLYEYGSAVLLSGGAIATVIARETDVTHTATTLVFQDFYDGYGVLPDGNVAANKLSAVNVAVSSGILTDSAPNTILQTWNDGSEVFNSLLIKVTNTASDGSSKYLDIQNSVGTSLFNVGVTGSATSAGEATFAHYHTTTAAGAFHFNTRGYLSASDNGIFQMTNEAQTDFARLQFGGTTSSFPALKRNATALNVRLADDSADAPITASTGTFSVSASIPKMSNLTTNGFVKTSGSDGTLSVDTATYLTSVAPLTLGTNLVEQRNGTTAQAFRLCKTYTDVSNYECLNVRAVGNIFYIDQDSAGTGTARAMWIGTNGAAALNLATNGTDRWNISSGGHLLVTSGSLDIGASGANRPRDYYGAGFVDAVGGFKVNATAGLTLNCTVIPTAITITGGIITARTGGTCS